MRVSVSAGSKVRRSARAMTCITERRAWKPSGRRPSTSRVRLILAGARMLMARHTGSCDLGLRRTLAGQNSGERKVGWRVLPHSLAPAGQQLARSEALWREVGAGGVPPGAVLPTLRWYGYSRPAVVLGVGQRPEAVDAAAAAGAGVQVERRTSGGTAVLADETMLALDVAVPAADARAGTDILEAYRWLGAAIRDALAPLLVSGAERLRPRSGFHLATSSSTILRKSSGELATTSMNWRRSFSRTSGSAHTLAISSCSRFWMAAGVFAGAMKPSMRRLARRASRLRPVWANLGSRASASPMRLQRPSSCRL